MHPENNELVRFDSAMDQPRNSKFEGWRQLPSEIISRILSLLEEENRQRTLVECLLVDKTFYHAAKEVLYSRLHLTSTYRVAQLVTCLRRHQDNALLVRKLDLSKLRNGENSPGWREWQECNLTTRKHQESITLKSLERSPNPRKHRSGSNVSNVSTSSTSSNESVTEQTRRGKLNFLWNKLKRHRKRKSTTRENVLLTSRQIVVSTHVNTPASSTYATSRDLPLGHVLHLLRLCRNLVHVDLSYLILFDDFELPVSRQRQPRSMIPGASMEPRAVYLTDSTRPIDINRTQLHKLKPELVFEALLQIRTLSHLHMDNVLWIKRSMIADYVLRGFVTNNPLMSLSFKKSGLHTHSAWACQGSLEDMVSLVIMDHVASIDNVALQQIFPRRVQSHPDILEISCVFAISLQLDVNFNARITILKASENSITHRLRKISPQYVSLVIELKDAPPSPSQNTAVERRLLRRVKSLLRKLKELRDADFRSGLGQNYSAPVAVF